RPPAPLELAPGEEAVWDARLALTVMEPGWSVVVEAARPVLVRGAERQGLEAAAARWLLRPRVLGLLGRINDTKTG
ncbi:MAG: hypothetical protein H7124_08470, partial [Phycisphaerales bacterium]|nr:hypothetical protein [Hyphomonadaceae bacterium]